MRTRRPFITPLILMVVVAGGCAGPTATSLNALPQTLEVAQEPVLPFEAVSGSVKIAGEIHRVPGSDPRNVVIIMGGSGSHSRHDVKPALPMFLSDDLAVALFDRRGSGLSTGTMENPGTANSEWQIPVFADDAAAVANTLSAMGFERVGVVGTSMGGWLSVAAAARTDLIDYVVAINGGASSVAVSDAFDALTDQGLSIEQAIDDLGGLSLSASYSPETDLAQIHQPVLWIMGELDDSNPTMLDLEVVERWKLSGKNFEAVIVEGADHNFINVETGEPSLGWLQIVSEFVRNENTR